MLPADPPIPPAHQPHHQTDQQERDEWQRQDCPAKVVRVLHAVCFTEAQFTQRCFEVKWKTIRVHLTIQLHNRARVADSKTFQIQVSIPVYMWMSSGHICLFMMLIVAQLHFYIYHTLVSIWCCNVCIWMICTCTDTSDLFMKIVTGRSKVENAYIYFDQNMKLGCFQIWQTVGSTNSICFNSQLYVMGNHNLSESKKSLHMCTTVEGGQYIFYTSADRIKVQKSKCPFLTWQWNYSINVMQFCLNTNFDHSITVSCESVM